MPRARNVNTKQFPATVYAGGRTLYLGRFATRLEADAARARAQVDMAPAAPRRAPTYITLIKSGWMAGRYAVNLPRRGTKLLPFATLDEARACRDEYCRSHGLNVPNDAPVQVPVEPPFDVDSLFA